MGRLTHFAIWALFFISLLWVGRSLLLGHYPDFVTQYYVPHFVFSGANPYSGGEGLFTPQVYPPTEFFLFIPFSLFPLEISQYIYWLVSFICLVSSLFLLAKLSNISFFSKMSLLFSSCAFLSFPTKFTFGMGQINMIILLFLCLVLYFLKTKKDFLSGMFLGLSLVVKLFPILLPFYFLLKKRWKSLMGCITLMVISIIFVIIFIPKDIYTYFLFDIVPTLGSSWKHDYYNQAVSGVVVRSLGQTSLAEIVRITVSGFLVAISLIIVLLSKRKDFNYQSIQIGLLLTVNVLINTFSWQHHFVWLIIPFYVLGVFLIKNKYPKKYIIVLLVSYVLVSVNLKNPTEYHLLMQSHVFFGGILLYLLNIKVLFDNLKRG